MLEHFMPWGGQKRSKKNRKARSNGWGDRLQGGHFGASVLELLEKRAMLSGNTFTPSASVADSTTTTDNNLRSAITAANADTGSLTDTIKLTAGTYKLTLSELSITSTAHTLIIEGTGSSGAGATIIQQTAADRVLQVASGVTVIFEDLEITGGTAETDNTGVNTNQAEGGGILNDAGFVTLDNVAVIGNKAVGQGTSGQNAVGGGIFNTGGLNIENGSVIKSNSAIAAGGVAGNPSSGSEIGDAEGGGIFSNSEASLSIGNSTIEDNIAQAGTSADPGGQPGFAFGGGIYIFNAVGTNQAGSSQLSGDTIDGNQAIAAVGLAGTGQGGQGGGFAFGGGIEISYTEATQSSPGNGGPAVVTNCTISNNTAQGGAGGAAGPSGSGGTGGIGVGGGVDSEAPNSEFSNDTFYGNKALGGNGPANGTSGSAFGGGLDDDQTTKSSGLLLINVTMTANVSQAGTTGAGGTAGSGVGGGLNNDGSFDTAMEVQNSLFAGNTAGTGADVFGQAVNTDDNLLGVYNDFDPSQFTSGDPDGGFSAANGDQIGSTTSPINAKLGALANNGGTTDTVALLAGSPALGTGDPAQATEFGLTTDQRGLARIVNGKTDIGAFETQASGQVGVKGNNQAITNGSTTPSATNDTAFNSTIVGSSTTETYTITNTGSASLTLGPAAISGTNAGDFTVTTQPSGTLAAGASTTLVVRFTPSAAGSRTASVTFDENDPSTNGSFSFAISGAATTQAHIGVTGNGSAISDGATTTSATDGTLFNTTTVGSSVSETYTITNSGTAALTLGTVTIGGTNAGDFKVSSAPTSPVAPGSSVTFQITFQPTASGTRNASVSFSDNDPNNNPFTFDVSGVANTAAQIAVTGNGAAISNGSTTPSTANDTDFGGVLVGGTPVSETYTIKNTGSAALTVGTVTIGGANAGDFAVTQPSLATIPANGSTTFVVTFTPSAAGGRTASVNFSENDSSTADAFSFDIGGQGTAPGITVTGGGTTIADGATTTSATNDTLFGSTPLNGTAISETYTITNSGSAALTIGNVSIAGTNSSDFTVSQQPTETTIPAGGTATFKVQFAPTTAAGTRTAQVSFDENASGTSTAFTFAISGVATTDARIGVTGGASNGAITSGSTTPSSTNGTAFGSTSVGDTLSETYTIANSGNVALTLGQVTIAGADSGDFTVTTSPATSVAVGSTTTFTIQFAPTASGTRTATVSFDEDDSTVQSPFNFAISGQVPSPTIAVTGGGSPIADGSTASSSTNDTAFGNVAVGSSISETYTIANNGTAALTIGSVTIGGTNAADFKVTTAPTETSIPAGGSTTFTVQFTPSATGTRAATISFDQNDPAQTTPFTFAVGGVGGAPKVAVTGGGSTIADGSTASSSTNDTAFGNVAVGSSISETYTIANSGTAALTIGSVTIGGTNAADFKVTTPPTETSIPAGSSTTFTVQFTPSATGTRAATISFDQNDPTQTTPFTFAVGGVGGAPKVGVSGGGATISDGSTTASATNDTAFGSTTVGGTALSETYTITNSGSTALTIGSVTIGGTNAADFKVTTAPTETTIPAGGTTTFTVQFTPSAAGTRTATISFDQNDSSQASPFTFAVSGVATANNASLTGSVFDDVNQNGEFDSAEVGLSNIVVTLTETVTSGNPVTQTTMTNSSGSYTFSNLAAGSYTVTASLPTDLTTGNATPGNSGGTVGSTGIAGITLAAGATATGYDFSTFGLAPQFVNINMFLASSASMSSLLNQQPTISTLPNETVTSGTTPTATPFTVGDSLASAASLTLGGTSSNTTLVPNANIVFAGSGADRTITVTPASGQIGTTTITTTVTDPYGNLTTENFTLDVTAAAPVVTPSGTPGSFTEGGSAVAVDSGVKVTSSDTDLTGAKVTISSSTLQPSDTLGFATQNGITGSYNSSTGVLTLSGSATPTQYQTALQSVTFSTTSTNTTARSIAIVALDNALTSNSATETVTLAASSLASPLVDAALAGESDWTS